MYTDRVKMYKLNMLEYFSIEQYYKKEINTVLVLY